MSNTGYVLHTGITHHLDKMGNISITSPLDFVLSVLRHEETYIVKNSVHFYIKSRFSEEIQISLVFIDSTEKTIRPTFRVCHHFGWNQDEVYINYDDHPEIKNTVESIFIMEEMK